MTFQDEFVRRLNAVRGVGDGGEDTQDKSVRLERSRETGDGGDVSRLRSTRTGEDGEDTRHPEFISGPLAGEPEDRGERDGVLSRQAIEDKRVQDDEDTSGDGGEVIPPSRSREGDSTRHDGWHRELRVRFLEALAQTGNVQASAYFVQRSRQSAYDLKRRDPDFARAWLAALVLAREEAQDKLQERAIEGVEEEIFYHGEVVATRRRYDARLLLAHLARLDKIAAEIPAQRGAARFGDMLDAIAAGEDTAPLIATPTEEELVEIAAEQAERARRTAPPPEENIDDREFYAVVFPDEPDETDYYRLTPEEAVEMEQTVPGLTARPTGARTEAALARFETRTEFAADLAALTAGAGGGAGGGSGGVSDGGKGIYL